MVDSRFFSQRGPLSLGLIAEQCGAVLTDPTKADQLISVAAPLHRATADAVSFATEGFGDELAATKAGAVFVTEDLASRAPEGCVVLISRHVQASWATCAGLLHSLRLITEQPAVHPSAMLEEGVVLAPGVVIGPGAQVGRGSIIGSYAVIGPGVSVGRDCRISAHVSLTCALLGDRVSICAGTRIGEPGFGVAAGPKGLVEVPQLGRVILQDDVTIGANSTIDRGSFDDTVLGEGTKLDNLVHIGHNCQLGRHCVVAGFTGISGSVTVGDGVSFGGQVGVADHLHIGAGARLAGASRVMKDVPAGETWCGAPARPIRQFFREAAAVARLAKGRSGTGG